MGNKLSIDVLLVPVDSVYLALPNDFASKFGRIDISSSLNIPESLALNFVSLDTPLHLPLSVEVRPHCSKALKAIRCDKLEEIQECFTFTYCESFVLLSGQWLQNLKTLSAQSIIVFLTPLMPTLNKMYSFGNILVIQYLQEFEARLDSFKWFVNILGHEIIHALYFLSTKMVEEKQTKTTIRWMDFLSTWLPRTDGTQSGKTPQHCLNTKCLFHGEIHGRRSHDVRRLCDSCRSKLEALIGSAFSEQI